MEIISFEVSAECQDSCRSAELEAKNSKFKSQGSDNLCFCSTFKVSACTTRLGIWK